MLRYRRAGKLKPCFSRRCEQALEIPVDDLEFADAKVRTRAFMSAH